MKKITFILGIAALFTATVTAAAKPPFTCEQIKDKATRAGCIEDRMEKEKTAEADKMNALAAEREKAVAQEKANELESFVRKSKDALTKYYKDPSSAQFANLVVSEAPNLGWRTFCGSVNAKNSYGGYVGFKMFYVHWQPSYGDQPEIWNEGESTQKVRDVTSVSLIDLDLKLRANELAFAKLYCEASVITKIDK